LSGKVECAKRQRRKPGEGRARRSQRVWTAIVHDPPAASAVAAPSPPATAFRGACVRLQHFGPRPASQCEGEHLCLARALLHPYPCRCPIGKSQRHHGGQGKNFESGGERELWARGRRRCSAARETARRGTTGMPAAREHTHAPFSCTSAPQQIRGIQECSMLSNIFLVQKIPTIFLLVNHVCYQETASRRVGPRNNTGARGPRDSTARDRCCQGTLSFLQFPRAFMIVDARISPPLGPSPMFPWESAPVCRACELRVFRWDAHAHTHTLWSSLASSS